jgi:hypothetical protein
MTAADRDGKREFMPGDHVTAFFGSGFYRRAVVIHVDNDGLATVRYPEYPWLGRDFVKVENLS